MAVFCRASPTDADDRQVIDPASVAELIDQLGTRVSPSAACVSPITEVIEVTPKIEDADIAPQGAGAARRNAGSDHGAPRRLSRRRLARKDMATKRL
jgi:hypothetical protein